MLPSGFGREAKVKEGLVEPTAVGLPSIYVLLGP